MLQTYAETVALSQGIVAPVAVTRTVGPGSAIILDHLVSTV